MPSLAAHCNTLFDIYVNIFLENGVERNHPNTIQTASVQRLRTECKQVEQHRGAPGCLCTNQYKKIER